MSIIVMVSRAIYSEFSRAIRNLHIFSKTKKALYTECGFVNFSEMLEIEKRSFPFENVGERCNDTRVLRSLRLSIT